MYSFYVTNFFIWMTEFQEIFRENFIAMFSCNQTLMLFGRIGQLVYPIFLQVFSYLYTFLFRLKNTIQMPNYHCSVGGCNSDSSLSDKIVKRSHVKGLKFHHFEKDESKTQLWKVKVDKDLNGFIASDNKYVCSNYF